MHYLEGLRIYALVHLLTYTVDQERIKPATSPKRLKIERSESYY